MRKVALGVAACGLLQAAQTMAQPATPDDAQFRQVFSRQYDQLKGVKPDMLVEELRLRVELVASRGSQIGAASNDKRLRGFESQLLHNLQGQLCRAGSAPAARPSPLVFDSVVQAAAGQRLRTEGGDVAELSAISQRLVESQPAARLCGLTSLDEVR